MEPADDSDHLPFTDGPVQSATEEHLLPSSHSENITHDHPASDEQCNEIDLRQAQEIFYRFRSKSEGAVSAFPKKGVLKKNTNSDHAANLQRRVSFADTNGFALEQIRSFEVQPPTDFVDDDDDLLPKVNFEATRHRSKDRRFVPYFTLPWSEPGRKGLVFAALEDRKVILETFLVNSPWKISGTILVKNLSYHKRVFVKQTLDKWQTHTVVDATFLNSANENVDRFRFELQFSFKLPPGTRLELVLGYEVSHGPGQYWDSNCGNNYAFWYNDKA